MEIERSSLEQLYDLVSYPPSGRDGDGQLIVDFIQSIEDGEWLQRWRVIRDLFAPDLGSAQYVVYLREGLAFRVVCDYNGQPEVAAIDPLIVEP